MPSDLEARERRREAILEILREKDTPVRSQGELVGMLRQRGIPATQPSVSRDLQELGIRRWRGRYLVDVQPGWSDEWDLGRFTEFIEGFRTAGPYQTLVKTRTGMARIVGMAIDTLQWPEVVGTIAGEDTLLVCTANEEDQQRVLQKLAPLMRRNRGVPPRHIGRYGPYERW